MKTAQLIHRTETILYIGVNGVLSIKNPTEKLAHTIAGGETKTMVQEEVIRRIKYKNRKELDATFWQIMEEGNLNSREYYLILDNN